MTGEIVGPEKNFKEQIRLKETLGWKLWSLTQSKTNAQRITFKSCSHTPKVRENLLEVFLWCEGQFSSHSINLLQHGDVIRKFLG